MRKINLIIIHCSDSDNPNHDNVETIRQWHVERGFNDIGYHYLILKDGTIKTGRPENKIGAHCRGFNSSSIGLCLTGSKLFSDEQFQSCATLIHSLMKKYDLELKDILPHNEFSKEKTCPNFELQKIIERINL